VSRRYRELGSEAPSPALDASILRASRRAIVSGQRWRMPLAAVAVVVLALAAALLVEREHSDTEAVEAPARRARSIPQTAPVQPAPASEAKADSIEQSPERWLERIAELRKQGRHEEADKALAEFRQRYPDYTIP